MDGGVEEEIFYMWIVEVKTIRSADWWLLPLLVVTLLTGPSAAQADLCPALSDSFDGRHDRMICMVDSESHAAVFLHLEIRWQLVVWTTNAGVLPNQTATLGQTTTSLDASNQILSSRDPFGRTTTFTYDPANGNLLTVKDPLNQVTTIGYNNVGQPTSVQGPIATEPPTTFAYDVHGNLLTTTDPLGNQTQRTYDVVSRLLSLTDPRGLVTQFRYDSLNRVTDIADARQGLTRFTYDPNGNLLTVTDAKHQATTYTYDNMDRLKTRKDALNRTETYSYDPAGNLASFTDRKGQQTTFQYDPLNRRTQAIYPDATTTFTYDAVGRLIHVADTAPGAGAIDFRYDSLDRLIQEITGQGAVAYQYDVLSRRIRLMANGLVPVTYQYDAASRLTQVAQGALTVGLGYDHANRRTSLTYPNGTSTSYAYDVASRLTNITHNSPSGLIEAVAYTYDRAGNRTSFTRANGTASLVPQAIPSATYDAANEQISFAGATLTYDQNGNLTNDGMNTYSWDARNRLAGISGGATASFSYDSLGRRISKAIGSEAAQFAYDGDDIVAEIKGGTVGTTYLRSLNIDEMFGFLRQDGSYFSIYDGLGSTLALTNKASSSAIQYSYEPFGKTQSSNPTPVNPFEFTGRENEGTGLYYYRARYYSPSFHRFVSEDPLEFSAGDVNLYAYVWNSPTNFTDQLGLAVVYPGPIPPGCEPLGQRKSFTQRFFHNIGCASNFLPAGGMILGGRAAGGAARTLDELSNAARAADRNNLTKAGRALQKHSDRSGTAFEASSKKAGDLNRQGQEAVDDILTSPGSSRRPNKLGGEDVFAPDGRDVRYNPDGSFRGFLEP